MFRIACVAETVRTASRLAPAVGERAGGAPVEPFSLTGYLAVPDPPRRVVLCPAGSSVLRDVRFLERAARRLLWPAPPARLADAIGGIRAEGSAPDSPPASPRRASRARGGGGPALLLEGVVDAPRARAALRRSATRHWIVETPGRVRLTERELAALAREGVRWAVLEPVTLVAVCAAPALARAARRWRALLPPRTSVWIRA